MPRGRKPAGRNIVPQVQEGSLSVYLKQIASNQPLTSKDEATLSRRIRAGCEDALQKLVLANLRFVVSVAHTYKNQGLPVSDLINEGNLGLIRAARRFDEKKNFRFISYAVWWIRQAILQALAEQSRIVRLPLNRVSSIYKIGLAQSSLLQRNHRTANSREIAEELGIQERDVQSMIRVGNRHMSLDAPFGDGTGTLHDTLSLADTHADEVEQSLMKDSLEKEVAHTLDTLTPREREIISYYYGIGSDIPCTLDEIGQRLNLTRERVRQIKQRALEKLKQPSANERLRVFAEQI